MNLTELLASLAIFLTASSAFTESLISVKQNIERSVKKSESAVMLLETDSALRKKIRSLEIPYWKNFDSSFKPLKENLELFCEEKGIKGKDITPFLLAKIAEVTGGKSLDTNIALVLNNAELGAKIAVEYANLKTSGAK